MTCRIFLFSKMVPCRFEATEMYLHTKIYQLDAKPIKDKSILTISHFLYEIIYWHECIKIQTNDQWKDFANEVCNVFESMIGTEQHITLVYNHQLNGIIKDLLVKVLNVSPCNWSSTRGSFMFTFRLKT